MRICHTLKRVIQCSFNIFFRRSFLLVLFAASSMMCLLSVSMMSLPDSRRTSTHLGVQRSKLYDLNYDQFTSTDVNEEKTRLYNGYYGDGYNVRSLPPDIFKLAPEAFDNIPHTFLPGYKNPCFYYRGPIGPPTLRCLPYFYLIGMQKCGSTDLWEKINAHDEIQWTEKEPHWWARYRVRDVPIANGVHYKSPLSLSWYLDVMSNLIVPQFMQNPESTRWLVVGDGSTSTLWDNQWQNISEQQKDGPTYIIADVMQEIQPNAKFIVVLRNPSKRVYSDYMFFGNDGDDFVSRSRFHSLVTEGIGAYNRCLEDRSHRACTYLLGTNHARLLLGHYAVFLHDWFAVYPRDQFFVLRLEDWQADCPSLLPQIYEFLDLSPHSSPQIAAICNEEKMRVNTEMRRHMGSLMPETKMVLDSFYKPMNEMLAELLNDRRFLWEDGESNNV